MQVAIIGAGNVGGGLAERWAKAGHSTTIVGRDEPLSPQAEVVLLAIPASAAADVVRQRSPELSGKVLIDATNDVSGTTRSLAGMIREAAPEARVVKAFNTVFAAIYGEIDASPGVADMAYCGNDERAKELVAALIADAGFRPIDCGGLEASADLEGFARMVIRTAYAVGRGPFAYRFDAPDRLG